MMVEGRTFKKKTIPPSLVLSTNFDGALDNHLDQLADLAGKGLDEIYQHCTGYPEEGKRTPQSRKEFLKKQRELKKAEEAKLKAAGIKPKKIENNN